MRELPSALYRVAPWTGPALTLVTLGVGHLLWRSLFPEATLIPGAAIAPTFLAVVLSTFLSGRTSGLISATLVTIYVAALTGLAPEGGNFTRLALIGSTLYASVLLVGRLKEQADRAVGRERDAADRERRDAAEAKRANEVLKANNETLETFVYVITHDLKEPVRAMDHHLQTARSTTANPEGEVAIDEAIESNRRLGVLLMRLLEYSRASLTTPIQRPLTLREVLDDAVCRPIYEHTVRIRRAKLEVSEEDRAFLGDPTLLGQAIGNLILNAVKHNPRDEPRVTIVVKAAEGATVDILIQDNGPGFPESLLRRFNTLKPNKPATISGGFGLVIAKRALERLNGTMTITNLTEGAEVRLRLPAEGEPRDEHRVPITVL